jgi:hypothetical protein
MGTVALSAGAMPRRTKYTLIGHKAYHDPTGGGAGRFSLTEY